LAQAIFAQAIQATLLPPLTWMALWIRITQDNGKPYHWNPETHAVSWTLDESQIGSLWIAEKNGDATYYWNKRTRETTWDIPTQRSSAPPVPPPPQTPTSQNSFEGLGHSRPSAGWQFTVKQGSTGVEVAGNDEAAPNPQEAHSAEFHEGFDDALNAWVEVESDVGQLYYWNYRKMVSVVSLPQGEHLSWRARRCEGNYYYTACDTGQSCWTIKDMPSFDLTKCLANRTSGIKIEPGAALVLNGLVENSEFNNHVCTVTGFHLNRVVVMLPQCLGSECLAVRAEKLQPLPPGSIVEFTNLSQTNLNGEIATVEKYDPSQSRYHVRLRDGSVKSVTGIKVLPRSRCWDLDVGLSSPWLQWRKEQTCLFIDSEGNHRRYSVHLPLNFSQANKATKGKTQCAWPMILYLHGSGGCSFFTHSKKTLRSNGLQFAASHFVIVSPSCDWTWQETPRPWILELANTLRAAHWIDHRRIYLTGCSMGGMSTWEIAAARPDIFAAIAPVAGHHRPEREDGIARSIGDKPVFIVHSMHDETCPARLEEPLWNKLVEHGNRQMVINLAPAIDHCSMYERTYCDDTTLYSWLLSHRL